MHTVTLRRITKQDLPALQNIGTITFSETFEEINTPENMEKYLNDKFNLEQLTLEMKHPDSQFFFAEIAGKVVGYLKINKGEAQTEHKLQNALEIERIYVLKSYHGKKVGKLLFDKALEIAKQEGFSIVWLGVWENNLRAIKFYEKYGFKSFSEHIFMLGDDEQIDTLMKLSL